MPSLATTPLGHSHALTFRGSGEWTLVELWAHWCGPCLESVTSLVPWAEETRSLRFVAVGIDRPEDVGDAQAAPFLDAASGQPVLYLGGPSVLYSFKLDSVPAFILVDPRGTVASTHRGSLSEEVLDGWRRTITAGP